MKRTIFIAGFAALLMTAACAPSEQSENAAAKQIVGRMFEAFNRHDAIALAALYSEDAVVITPESCEPTIGRESIAQSYQTLFDQVPGVQDTVQDMIAENGQVAVGFVASGQIDGAAFELPIAAILTIENGLIIRDIGYFNSDQDISCD